MSATSTVHRSGYYERTDPIISAQQLLTSLECLGNGVVNEDLRNRILTCWNMFATNIQQNQSDIYHELACVDGPGAFYFLSRKFIYNWIGIKPSLQPGLENRTALYKKKENSSSFTFQAINVNRQMHLLWHTNITFGNGCFKKGKAVIDMHTGNIYAQLITQKPHKWEIPGEGVMYLDDERKDKRRIDLSTDTYHEARTYMALNHPNILNTLFHGHITTRNLKGRVKDEECKRREIIVEHCLGNFSDFLESKPIPATAIRIASECADGIDYMHQNGYFHLDLKPENLLVDTKQKGKVADFGCSIFLSNNSQECLDETRLATVLFKRRLLFSRDIECIVQACMNYEKEKTHENYEQIKFLLGQVDVVQFSSVIQKIFDAFADVMLNPTKLKFLKDDMQKNEMRFRPTMKEVSDRLKKIKAYNPNCQ